MVRKGGEVEAVHPFEIVGADFTDNDQRAAIPRLLNAYAEDLLGFRSRLDPRILDRLVPGLEKTANALVLLARINAEYVGMAICFLGFSTFHAKPLVNIHDVMVQAEFRGLGIGQALLKRIEAIALAKGCCKITLEVQEKNEAARRLYRRLGFRDSFLDAEAGRQLFMTKAFRPDDAE